MKVLHTWVDKSERLRYRIIETQDGFRDLDCAPIYAPRVRWRKCEEAGIAIAEVLRLRREMRAYRALLCGMAATANLMLAAARPEDHRLVLILFGVLGWPLILLASEWAERKMRKLAALGPAEVEP